MNWKEYEFIAYNIASKLKEKGVNIKIITRSSIYPLNKGICYNGVEHYLKTWESVYNILYYMNKVLSEKEE